MLNRNFPMASPTADQADADVTVIIPTLGMRPRTLKRAMDSVFAQRGVTAVPFIVVNGTRFDESLMAELRANRNIRLLQIPEPSVSAARLIGRRSVATEFFAFLDDDDEFLPDGLQRSIAHLRANPQIDVVATNGYRQVSGIQTKYFRRVDHFPDDPARALLHGSWLTSAGGVFRTRTVGDELFADLPDHFEITLLALRLAMVCSIARIDEPTFVIHESENDRASQSLEHVLTEYRVICRMEEMARRPDLRRLLRKKRAAALHNCSDTFRKRGDLRQAWKYHCRSLVVGNGWRYLPYSRLLMRP
jgi:glycosyltransferase involved in cell wall biosynthesis